VGWLFLPNTILSQDILHHTKEEEGSGHKSYHIPSSAVVHSTYNTGESHDSHCQMRKPKLRNDQKVHKGSPMAGSVFNPSTVTPGAIEHPSAPKFLVVTEFRMGLPFCSFKSTAFL
jgi:hypothetical protein